jgi:lipoate-protein ligase A
VRGRKIAGSAQRRKGPAVLQHGSILLGPPPLPPAKTVPGTVFFSSAAEEAGRAVGYEEAASALYEEAAGPFGGAFVRAGLAPETALRAQELERGKYGSKEWIHRL